MNKFLNLTFVAVMLFILAACNKEEDFVPSVKVDKATLQFSYGGGVDSLAITSNADWVIEENADWITLSKTSGNSNAVVSVTVAENTVTAARNATITVKVAGLSDVTIEVTQSKALETVGLYILSEGSWGQGNAEIFYYDLKTEQITKKFSELNGKSIGDGVNHLALYGSKLYCTVSGGTGGTEGYVEVINPETGVSIKRIPVVKDGTNASPRNIIFHEGKAYVTTYSRNVVRIDTASLNIDGTAELSGDKSEGICLYNDNFYICNSGGGSGNTISVVNLASFTETKTITVPQNPMMIEATVSGDIYFTTADASWAGGGPSNLHILNPEQERVTKTFDVRASKIALTKDFVYAIDFDWNTLVDNISRIDLKTQNVTDISSIYDYMMVYSVSVNPLNGDFYLGNQGANVVAYSKDNSEKFNFRTTVPYILKVVPILK